MFIRRFRFFVLLWLAGVSLGQEMIPTPKYTIMYSLTGSNGERPFGTLIRDAAGNLYGTTMFGGGPWNAGTIFKADLSGNIVTLHTFRPDFGAAPIAGLVADANGNLYGAASGGGSQSCVGGCGVIFEVDATGQYSVLYTFTGGADGATPLGNLILDGAGNLYGTTRFGGILDKGTVFKLDASGVLTTLYRFPGYPDGEQPFSGLVADAAGNLYGTTYFGGNAFNFGTIFKIDTSGKESVLFRFPKGNVGTNPNGGLVLDDAGNLYGTTLLGGSANGGVIFKLDTAGNQTVLHDLTAADGLEPCATLLRDAAGNLYGTTYLGGSRNFGTVFRLEPNGRFRVLHDFLGGRDRGKAYAGLVRDAAGNLYGTTTRGGTDNFGTVFKISF